MSHIDWDTLDEYEEEVSLTDGKFKNVIFPFNYIFNTIAFILKIIVTAFTDAKDTITLIFKLIGAITSFFFGNMVKVIGISLAVGFTYSIALSYDTGNTRYVLYGIIILYLIKLLGHDFPSFMWDKAIATGITHKKHVIGASCFIIGSIMIVIPFLLTLNTYESLNPIVIVIGAAYGIYLAISYKILERM